MSYSIVLLRKLNHRNIELHHHTRGETVGVRLKSGEFRYLPWQGFIHTEEAKSIQGAKPVKLDIARLGRTSGINTLWEDVPSDHYVQGCLTKHGVFAVVEKKPKLVPG